MFNDIEKALEYVMERRNDNYSFAGFKKIMQKLNDPQNDLLTIHVAGTNGKGSTVAYLSSLLSSQGLKVGTMQSPHYETHLDRIRINGVPIGAKTFLELLNKNLSFIEDNHLSMFEIDYVLMCDYFKRAKVDVAIVETGLGGRLDSTNVIDNTFLSIITTIGYDHMDRLGNTLEEITTEKCGIIKHHSKVLIGRLDENPKDIVKTFCLAKSSKFHELGEYEDLGNRHFYYDGEEYEIESYAKYQIHNACLALEAFKIFIEEKGIEPDLKAAKEALKMTHWQGRFEIISNNPRIILDGAHNIHGIKALVESYDSLKGTKAIIFSALKRKEYEKMAKMLKEHCDRFIVTSFDYQGSIDDDLGRYEKAKDLNAGLELVKSYDNILICGSLYFISEAWQLLKSQGK